MQTKMRDLNPLQLCRSRLLFAALALGVALVGTGCAGDSAVPVTNEFHHDFRGQPLPPEFKLFQTVPESITTDPAGLRIKIERMPRWGSGIHTAFGVKGDFEVTLAFEMLQMDRSSSNSDIGLTLCLNPSTGDKDTTTTAMDRFFRRSADQGVRWFSRPTKQRVEKSCDDKACRLRMHRTGGVVRFAWAPGTKDGAFEEFGQAEWPNEIEHVRITLFGNYQPGGGVEARLIDFHIRANELTNIPVFIAEKGGLAKSVLIGMAITMLMAVVAWLFFRHRGQKIVATSDMPLTEKSPEQGEPNP
jgi:hypothetical protein